LTARWSIPDPVSAKGTEEQIQRAYFDAWRILDRRISLFLCLPLETLERDVVQQEIDKIGRSE
jgi:arsenate reductase